MTTNDILKLMQDNKISTEDLLHTDPNIIDYIILTKDDVTTSIREISEEEDYADIYDSLSDEDLEKLTDNILSRAKGEVAIYQSEDDEQIALEELADITRSAFDEIANEEENT